VVTEGVPEIARHDPEAYGLVNTNGAPRQHLIEAIKDSLERL
jgi:hypothetical protein